MKPFSLLVGIVMTVSIFAGTSPRSASSSYIPSIGPPVADIASLPVMKMPWDSSASYTLTGGPHNGISLSSCTQVSSVGATGLDFGLNNNEVLAVANGTLQDKGNAGGTIGNYVIIDHGGGWSTRYWHLNQINPTILSLPNGTSIPQGRLLAISGGNPSHLHLELRYNNSSSGISWHGVNLDGYVVRAMPLQSDSSKILNYQGTLTRGAESTNSINYAFCNNTPVTKWTGNGGTVQAGDGQRLTSTNVKNTGGSCSAPSLVSPGDGETVRNRTVTFDWNDANCSGRTGYTLHVTTGSGPEDGIIFDEGVGPSEKGYTFPNDGTFYWHVATLANGQRYGWSSRRIVIDTNSGSGGDGIELCDGTNYGAPCHFFSVGKYSDLSSAGWYDRAESVRFSGACRNGGCHAVLHSEKDFTGDPGHYDNDSPTLGNAQRNHVRSLNIYRNTPPPAGDGIELCDGTNFGGECKFFAVADPEGKYSDLSNVGFYDRAESVRFVGGCTGGRCHAVLHSEKDFTGDPGHYDNDAGVLGNAQQNHVRSVTVYRHRPPPPPGVESPSNNAVLADGESIALRWSANGDQYLVELWGGPGVNQIIGWQNESFKTLEPLPAGHTYFWKVRSRNRWGEGDWSQTWSFTVTLVDPRQEGPVGISGTLVEGNKVYITINVKNYGTGATPAIHPYVEGTNSAGQFWRADGAQPASAVIQPGQTVSFQVQHDLWRPGTWTSNGIFLWNNTSGGYWEPLPPNGQNQRFSFSVAPTQARRNPSDFNGDGKSDALWRHQGTGQNGMWMLNGIGVARDGYLPSVSDLAWQVAGTGDIDGDGKADVVWRNQRTGQNGAWLLDGIGLKGNNYLPEVTDLAWQVAGIGDIDGDGKADVVWRNQRTGQNGTWLLDGIGLKGNNYLPAVTDLAWQVASMGDYDGDGKTDVLWRNQRTGQNGMWLLHGNGVRGNDYLPLVHDLGWQVVGHPRTGRGATTAAPSAGTPEGEADGAGSSIAPIPIDQPDRQPVPVPEVTGDRQPGPTPVDTPDKQAVPVPEDTPDRQPVPVGEHTEDRRPAPPANTQYSIYLPYIRR